MSELGGFITHIRPMTVDDIKTVYDIDVQSFSLPWTERAYRHDLLKNPGAHMWVAELVGANSDKKVVGMIVIWFIVDEGHIGTIAVHPDYRRRGIGGRLLSTALVDIKNAGAIKVYLEVRESNLAAQSLYKKLGFIIAGVRKRYYKDNGEDAYLMVLEGLDEHDTTLLGLDD